MAELTQKQQILLLEYEQASEMCRNHDKLLRTGLVIFGAVQAAWYRSGANITEPS